MGFIRERGIVGFAIGFILGGAVTKLTTSFVNDLLNPVLGLVFGATKSLEEASFRLGSQQTGFADVKWGQFTANLIDFLILAFVVYFGVKILGLEKIDKKKGK